MALEFKLPDIGEGIAEGEIVKWLVAAGEAVEEHQAVVEVMTDKATVEVPSPRAGVVTELRAAEGEVVPVGDVIFVLDEAGAPVAVAAAPAPTASAAPEATQASAPAPEPAAGSGGALLEFKLPDIGEGIAEGEIVQWLVAAGDAVEEHQAVVEVMTDKATVEIPSPAAGTVGELRIAAGEVVPIGTVIFTLATGGGAPASGSASAAAASAPATTAVPVTSGTNGTPVARTSATDGKVLAVPSARRVARELGIDLAAVPGSGRGGIVRRADVEAFSKSGAPPAATTQATAGVTTTATRSAAPAVSLAPGERETRVPFRGVRRKIAEAMTRSKFTATHFTVVEELDVTELVDVRAKAKAIGAEEGVKVTYMPFLMKAAASALAKYPELNSQLDEAANEIVTYHYVNLGIATDTANGLIVPVIRDVGAKGMLQLAAELGDLAERTRAGKVKPDDLRGGTFTITNAGNIGGTLATPIINFPEVGVLGVHRIVKRPGIVETPDGDEIAVRHYMNLSISVDHRLVDGASAVRFLVHMKRLLESPGLLAL